MFKFFHWLRGIAAAIFGKSEIIPISTDMESAISTWARLYRGEDNNSLGLPATIAAEFARLVTLEMRVNLSGSERAGFLSAQLRDFLSRIRVYTEYGCALGGIAFKPYVQGNRIIVDAVQADCFFPTAFDSSNRMTGAVFVDQMERDGQIFTRLERHEYISGRHTIENRAFVSPAKNAASGARPETAISLTDVPEWADIAPEMTLENVDRPLFSYFRVPFANPIDRHSPLGVSVFSRAVNQIEDANSQYARLLWEFEGGELAVDAEESFLLPQGENPLPRHQKRLFRRMYAKDQNFYQVFSPALRDESLINGLNSILRMVEWQCGMVYGTLSDPRLADRTAQEVRTSKQRSYTSVLDIQMALQYSLDDLIYAMDALATLYGLAPEGAYDAAYEWDDSIIVDPESWVEGMRADTEMGLLRPELYLSRKYGVTVSQALAMMPGKTAAPAQHGEQSGN